MEASQTAEDYRHELRLPDVYNEGYIHQFLPEPTDKIQKKQRNCRVELEIEAT